MKWFLKSRKLTTRTHVDDYVATLFNNDQKLGNGNWNVIIWFYVWNPLSKERTDQILVDWNSDVFFRMCQFLCNFNRNWMLFNPLCVGFMKNCSLIDAHNFCIGSFDRLWLFRENFMILIWLLSPYLDHPMQRNTGILHGFLCMCNVIDVNQIDPYNCISAVNWWKGGLNEGFSWYKNWSWTAHSNASDAYLNHSIHCQNNLNFVRYIFMLLILWPKEAAKEKKLGHEIFTAG